MTEKKSDEIRFGAQIAPGTHVATRRDDEGEREVVVRTPGDGTPIVPGTEILSVNPKCSDGWHQIQTLYRSGPPQVATPAYRKSYDRIFGKKPDVGLA